MLGLKKKFGKNAVLKGTNYLEGATMKERNKQINGHKAEYGRNQMMRCIFCGRTEDEFNDRNQWTVEHIIPECLGNSTLILRNVCKQCNSNLGTYVDNYFVNHHFIKFSRQFFQLRSQNGVIPNAFQEGVTEEGQRIRMDENFIPSVVPSITQSGNKITIHANSVKEARTMAAKKLKRLHATPEQIQKFVSKIDESLVQEFQPEIRYDIMLDINRFLLEALKIGYEYALLKFGDAYWDDPTALKIRNRLNRAISGMMQDTCERPPEASYVPDYLMRLSRTPLVGAHWLSITSTLRNQLIAHIILFFDPVSSFQVLLSEQANCYLENGQMLEDFIDLPHKGGIKNDKL